MRFGLPISLVLHSGLIAAGLMVLPTPKLAIVDTPEIVPVDLVTLAEETNVIAQAPEPDPEPEITPLPAPPEAVPVPEPEPEKTVVLPPEPKPETKSKPVKKETAPKPKPKRQARPKKKTRPKVPAFDLARLENKLAKQAAREKSTSNPKDRTRKAIGSGDAMTASEIDLLRAQMYECWRAPLDAPYPEKLKVKIRARLNPDGTLSNNPEVLNLGQIKRSGDPFWQAAADSARRAVLKCQPYTLPADKYAQWRETIMNFNPADVLGN